EDKDARTANDVKLKLSVIEDGAQAHEITDVAFPYFGGAENPHFTANAQAGGDVMVRRVPVTRLALDGDGVSGEVMVATVFNLLAGNYGVNRGLDGEGEDGGYDANAPYTPAWQ